ncbi:hypothetical protein SAMN05216570_1029 [Dyella sp. OK004]|uniref:hypothetical protein n=1 Tax=Dyella sp. OK004 TaxID=1855292 RepID=UPI0008E2251C|nr:hypothetical protein [Dyella sp. OK004]SFR94673.1 hypothetical protein SAMN05216570_1029 [Dyella sp. OK004]
MRIFLRMFLRRAPKALVIMLACLFGALLTLASMTQSVNKLDLSGSSTLTSTASTLDPLDHDDAPGQDGKCVVDDQCLDDILVEPSIWLTWNVPAPSIASAPAPTLHDGLNGLITPPPNV